MADAMRSLAALRAAVDGVAKIPSLSMSQNVPKSPDLSRSFAEMQNEPTASSRADSAGSSNPQDRRGRWAGRSFKPARGSDSRPRMSHNVPECPGETPNAQNEPMAAWDELSPRQLSAIALLFAGRSFSAVGRALNISRRTLYRWRQMPAFEAEISARATGTRAQRESREPVAPRPVSWKEFQRMMRATGKRVPH